MCCEISITELAFKRWFRLDLHQAFILGWAGTNQFPILKPVQDYVSIDKIQNTDVNVRCMPPNEQNHCNHWQYWQHFMILPFMRSFNPPIHVSRTQTTAGKSKAESLHLFNLLSHHQLLQIFVYFCTFFVLFCTFLYYIFFVLFEKIGCHEYKKVQKTCSPPLVLPITIKKENRLINCKMLFYWRTLNWVQLHNKNSETSRGT